MIDTSGTKAHALFSPSGAHRWLECPGSLALCQDVEDKSSEYAAEGTAAHTLAEWVFADTGRNALAYEGRIIEVEEADATYEIEVTEEMCNYVQNYVDAVMERLDNYSNLGEIASLKFEVERQVDFSHVVGEEDQFGTVDAFAVVEYVNGDTILFLGDLKYGRGVAVKAPENKQLKTYSLGALHEHDLTHNVVRIDTAIFMVRKEYISEHSYDVSEIEEFAEVLDEGASKGKDAIRVYNKHGACKAFELYLNPGESQCRFCPVKGSCKALARNSMKAMSEKFDDLDSFDEPETREEIVTAIDDIKTGKLTPEELGRLMDMSELVDDWLRAVRQHVFAELNLGRKIPGYKLVEGKRGARKWSSELEAEELLKSMRLRLDEMYTRKLVSPTQLEKILKKDKTTRRWTRAKTLITQADGKPSVTTADDPKPALVVASEFDDIEEEDTAFDDLA